jgi:hypothetical protein
VAEIINIPADLTLIIDDDELRTLETTAVAEFDRLRGEKVTPESLELMTGLAQGIERIRSEFAAREARARDAADAQARQMAKQQAVLESRVFGNGGTQGDGEGEPDGHKVGNDPGIDTEGIAAAAARGAMGALITAMGSPGTAEVLTAAAKRQAASLAQGARHAPTVTIPARRLSVKASVDIPGIARDSDLPTLDDLVRAFHRRAKGMPVTRDGRGREELVASIRNEYENVADDRDPPKQIQALFDRLTRREQAQALVAGGGWCAPSEIRYDFFNIAAIDGLVDLPTFGVSRGGIRFPTSPSLADVYTNPTALVPFGGGAGMTSGTMPFLWTETDDIATVTGNPNKPTIRVPCPSFNEARLECYGISVTAGNLTDDAYPEATANFLKLVLAAHAHAQNGRYLAQMVALSTNAASGVGAFAGVIGAPVTNQVLGAVGLAATDYRARFGMGQDDVLEVIFPDWIKEMIRADLAYRTNVNFLDITDAQITALFTARGIRPQFVNDWQVRGTGQPGNPNAFLNTWPTQVEFMLYAAGTFLLGNGMTLDLGVVRDSVLNAENDFTAAWSEECHLLIRYGHASWRYFVPIDISGAPPATLALSADRL